MITKTTVPALRALLFVAPTPRGRRTSPREVAGRLGESPPYMAKLAQDLVKAVVLRPDKRTKGSLYVARSPSESLLIEIVRACQGEFIGDCCQFPGDIRETCSYHQAPRELREAVTGVLSAWTLERLMERPCAEGDTHCMMLNQQSGPERTGAAKRI